MSKENYGGGGGDDAKPIGVHDRQYKSYENNCAIQTKIKTVKPLSNPLGCIETFEEV